jgi:hypothetical protein
MVGGTRQCIPSARECSEDCHDDESWSVILIGEIQPELFFASGKISSSGSSTICIIRASKKIQVLSAMVRHVGKSAGGLPDLSAAFDCLFQRHAEQPASHKCGLAIEGDPACCCHL